MYVWIENDVILHNQCSVVGGPGRLALFCEITILNYVGSNESSTVSSVSCSVYIALQELSVHFDPALRGFQSDL